MAGRPKKSMAVRLDDFDLALTNASTDDRILTPLGKRGYGVPKLDEGRGVYLTAKAAAKAAPAALGTQKDSTTDRNKAGKDAMGAYQDLSNTIKAHFDDDEGVLEKVGLNHPMPRTLEEFPGAADKLFGNAATDPVIRAGIAEHGYDDAMLQAERAKVDLFIKLIAAQTAAVADKEGATSDEGAAMAAADDWVSEFRKIAKIALKGKPNLLRKLGIKVLTVKTKAQRNAPKKAAATRAAKKAAKK